MDAIREGGLGSELPGYRELERMLGVSRTSLMPALDSLVRKGLLIPRGPRRRFGICPDHGEAGAAKQGGRLVILEANTLGVGSLSIRRLVADLHEIVGTNGWEIMHLVERADQSRASPKRWQRLVDSVHANAVMVAYGHRPTLEWAVSCGRPALGLGGDPGELPIPIVSFDLTRMIHFALERLFETGHTDVCVPIGVRTPGVVERVESTTKSCYERRGLPFHSRLHIPRWHANLPDAWSEGLAWRLDKKIPDALLLLGAGPFLTTLGVLLTRGLKIPRNISLVAVADRDELEWFRPPPCCFRLHHRRLAEAAAAWLRNPDSFDSSPSLHADWVEGETVLQRK